MKKPHQIIKPIKPNLKSNKTSKKTKIKKENQPKKQITNKQKTNLKLKAKAKQKPKSKTKQRKHNKEDEQIPKTYHFIFPVAKSQATGVLQHSLIALHLCLKILRVLLKRLDR